MLGVTAAFGAAVWLIGLLHGIPLTIPSESVSLALGRSALQPVALATVGYLVLMALRCLWTGRRRDMAGTGREMLLDLIVLICFVAANYFHFSLKMWVAVLNPRLYDHAYWAADLALEPFVDACIWLQTQINHVLSGHRWYQTLLHLNVVCAFCLLRILRSPWHAQFALAALLLTAVGAISYLVAPALGPFIFEAGPNPLATQAQASMLEARRMVEDGGAAWIAENGPAYFTGALGAMPSLHIAYVTVTLWFVWKARSPLVLLFAVGWCLTFIGAIATRWHYVVDLPVGILIAVACAVIAARLCRPRTNPVPQPTAASLAWATG